MSTVTTVDLAGLLARHDPPCVSVYMPTARAYPESEQDPIHYRNLVSQAEETLRRNHPAAQAAGVIRKFRDLEHDDVFWTHQLDGLAVLGSPDAFHVFELNRRVPERVVVADSFHVKPLLRIAQFADRFHVLCLQREEVRLFEGNRDQLAPIRPGGIPWTVTDALGNQAHKQPKDYASHPKNELRKGKSGEPTRHNPRGTQPGPGHSAKGDDAKLDAERFYRAVDRAVWEHVSRDSGLPLVVAALSEDQAIFRAVSQNPHVVSTGIERDPASMSEEDLRHAARQCMEPEYLARLDKLVEDFRTARAHQRGIDDLPTVARAAHEGRVGILLVEADRSIPGRLEPGTGNVWPALAPDAEADDLLDDLAETVMRTKGMVVVLPRDRMPSSTGVAATTRY
jgi:hypothetical protein